MNVPSNQPGWAGNTDVKCFSLSLSLYLVYAYIAGAPMYAYRVLDICGLMHAMHDARCAAQDVRWISSEILICR